MPSRAKPKGPPNPGGLRLRRAVLEELEIPLVRPFTTSFGTEKARRVLLLTLEERGGEQGYGECVAGRDPLYSYESVGTVREVLFRYLRPALASTSEAASPQAFLAAASRVRGHPMAKAMVEMALWDLAARHAHLPLQRLLAPDRALRDRVEVGVSVGLAPTPEELVRQLECYAAQGYGRLKLKVEPGRDRPFVLAARRAFPGARIWVDANQAYGGRDLPALRRLAREAKLEVVEQPFEEEDVLLHARLARALGRKTLVCLDESVRSMGSLELALREGALGCLNIKPGRVGGFTSAVALHDRAERARVPVWCGGMLETGIGRAHNLHLASLPNFRLPADLSASDRYWKQDVVEPSLRLERGSVLRVPKGPGIGVEPEERQVRRYRVSKQVLPIG
ncbi:MAG: o-succinylbenzoate synthase [Thermoplasmata archaeon]|nr:o-succinylbenzoate synthase [Thermoplasmata archaeon]